jgi:hypothetical protein
MVFRNPHLNPGAYEMNGEIQWTLHKIREAYGENLRLWNGLYPIHLGERSNVEEVTEDSIEYGDLKNASETICQRAKEVMARLKKSADLSGNSRVWRKGEPLDDLPRGMRERIERALNFGI